MSNTPLSAIRNRCRAKNPATCAYHGDPTRIETQTEAFHTATAVLDDTKGLLIDYSKPAEDWSDAEVKRAAHLVTAHDNGDKFARDILKERYGIAGSTTFEEIENNAGGMYRYRMTYLKTKIADDKRSSNVQRDTDLADTLQTLQLEAEYEATQFRRYAVDELHGQRYDARTRRDRANHEMARSIAASAQAFKIQQMLDNLGEKAQTPAMPVGFSF